MASSGRDDNSSQFFFTLNRADELSGKHTLFGKVREGKREGEGREGGREIDRHTERKGRERESVRIQRDGSTHIHTL